MNKPHKCRSDSRCPRDGLIDTSGRVARTVHHDFHQLRHTSDAEEVRHVAIEVVPRVLAADFAQCLYLSPGARLRALEAAAHRHYEAQVRPVFGKRHAAIQMADEVRALSTRLHCRVVVQEPAVHEDLSAHSERLEVCGRRRRAPRSFPQQRYRCCLRRRVANVDTSVESVNQIER